MMLLNPSTTSAPGSAIEVRIAATSMPGRTSSSFGPAEPLVPASASVWQLPQLDAKSCLPSGASPSAAGVGVGGFAAVCRNSSNFASDSTTAVARIVEWPRPQSSAQTIG